MYTCIALLATEVNLSNHEAHQGLTLPSITTHQWGFLCTLYIGNPISEFHSGSLTINVLIRFLDDPERWGIHLLGKYPCKTFSGLSVSKFPPLPPDMVYSTKVHRYHHDLWMEGLQSRTQALWRVMFFTYLHPSPGALLRSSVPVSEALGRDLPQASLLRPHYSREDGGTLKTFSHSDSVPSTFPVLASLHPCPQSL